MDERTDIFDLNLEELETQLGIWGEPGYRAEQLQRWIYHSLVDDFEQMTDLPHSLREQLKSSARIGALAPLTEQKSADGLTHKVLFQLADSQTLETVLMLYADAPDSPELAEGQERQRSERPRASASQAFTRRTVCISTQVGCPIGCPFCATGQAGFIRNLSAGEIIAQALYFARVCKRAGHAKMPLTNIVIMGMGEPLMKFDVTWRAIEAFFDPLRFGLGARRITVSTSGLIPGIERLAQLHSQVNLAVSLHTADNALRDVLVPINRRYPLGELMRACRSYVEQTRRRITFEYALMEGINDLPEHARALVHLLRGLLCHVNLIPLNPTLESPYKRPPYAHVKAFERILRESGIPTTLRVEKGIEIAAGCGQLRQVVGKSQSQARVRGANPLTAVT